MTCCITTVSPCLGEMLLVGLSFVVVCVGGREGVGRDPLSPPECRGCVGVDPVPGVMPPLVWYCIVACLASSSQKLWRHRWPALSVLFYVLKATLTWGCSAGLSQAF